MSEQVQMSESEKKKEDWMNAKWRPMMGWLYMGTCTFDFVIFPILWSLLQAATKGQITQWQPLTLQGAGLYHIAMGAVLGLAAFGRTQEKLAGANNGGAAAAPTAGFASGFTAPSAPAAGGFGSPSSFGSPAPVAAPKPMAATSGFGAPVATAAAGAAAGFGVATMAKPAPSRPPLDEEFPELD